MKNSGRRYSASECYSIIYQGMRTIRYLTKAKRASLMDDPFVERIMLAVTQVNGCALCSYAHTKMALETGMNGEEIRNLLSGEFGQTPTDQLPAILFAQHYAETKGHPSRETWDKTVTTYGKEKALGILAATRMIMVGNAFGIVLGSFKNRLHGKPDKESSLGYELAILLLFVPFLLLTVLHRVVAFLARRPIISF